MKTSKISKIKLQELTENLKKRYERLDNQRMILETLIIFLEEKIKIGYYGKLPDLTSHDTSIFHKINYNELFELNQEYTEIWIDNYTTDKQWTLKEMGKLTLNLEMIKKMK